jgi:hypothetical protein
MRQLFIIVGLFWVTSGVSGLLLPVPEGDGSQRLPGIPLEAKAFALDDVDATALVLLVYDLFCPTCQKSAGNMKRLADNMAEALPAVPILGIGFGDTPFEANKFKEKFKLPFPCVSDREKMVSDQFEIKHTPTVLVLFRDKTDQPFSEVYRHEGYLGREHLEQILTVLNKAP